MDPRPRLRFSQEISGHLARIWEYEDGRFLFDWLQPLGIEISIFCSSYEEAVSVWKGFCHDFVEQGAVMCRADEGGDSVGV